jgi:putative membrane protein
LNAKEQAGYLMRALIISSAFAVLVTGVAGAKVGDRKGVGFGNPGGTVPGAQEESGGKPSPAQPNQADRTFLVTASSGGAAEVDLAKLAEQNSGDGAVKTFARRMVQDHTEGNEELSKQADAVKIQLAKPDAEQKQVREGLAALQGPEFDIEYLRVQVQDHQRAAQLFEYEIGSGQDAAIQRLASKLLPTILIHLQMARDLLARSSAQNPRAAAAPSRITGMPTQQTPRPPKG